MRTRLGSDGPVAALSLVLFVALLLAVLGGCRTEPVTWRTPLHGVILFQDSLGWSDLVPDTLWTEGEEGLRLEVRSSQPLLDTDALIPDLDTAWTDVFTLPFIGGPIPVAPGAEVWSEDEIVSFAIPDAGLRRVRLSGGELVLRVASTVQGPLELRYTFTGAKFPAGVNEGSNEIVLTVNADTAEVVLPLNEVELDLDGAYNLIFSKLKTHWSVGVPTSATEPVGVMGEDELSLSVALTGLRVAQVEGRFDPQVLTLDDAIEVDDFGGLQSLEVGWTGLDVDLTLINTAGVDFTAALTSVTRTDSVGAALETTALEDASLGDAVFLPRAQVSGSDMGSWTAQPGTAQLGLSSDQGNLGDFLSSLPEAIGWSVILGINPLGDVSGGTDRLDLEQLPELEAVVSAPLAVSSARAVLVDTLDVVPPDWLDYQGRLDLTVASSLPVGATLHMELVDLSPFAQFLEVAFGPEWWRFDEVVLLAGSGDPGAPLTTVASLDFMQPHFEALRNGAKLRVEVVIQAEKGGAQFDAAQGVVVKGHLDGDAIISIQ